MSRRPILAVVYGLGSLAPMRLAEAAAAEGIDLLFVVGEDSHARSMMPALRLFGTVVDGAGMSDEQIAGEVAAHRPAGIATFSEWLIGATARLAAAVGLPYHRCEDLPAITRKDAQRARLAERGLSTIAAATISSVEDIPIALDHVSFPAIVKPIMGASSRNTYEVRSAEHLIERVSDALSGSDHALPEADLIVEEVLKGRSTGAPWGDYIAVDCVVVEGRARPVFVSSKFALAPPFRERGAYGGRSVEDAALIREAEAMACRAVEAVGIEHSIGDVEIKITPAGLRVIEVNGRLGAWVDDLAMRTGLADPARIAICAALGRPIPDIACDGSGAIAFHYIFVPPFGTSRVVGIDSTAALRAIPGVERVSVFAKPEMDVNWRRGGAASVGVAIGRAASHDELAATVAALEDTRWIHYR